MLQCIRVSMQYQHNGQTPVPVLADLDILINEVEFVCVLGPSGCGKTTLLNLFAGFIRPSQGRVLFDGLDIKGPCPERAVVFQDPTLFPWLTVQKNVEFGLRQLGVKSANRAHIARDYLELMGLSGHADAYPVALSGGMRQRVALARVLALNPRVLLMDEPFSALDAMTREYLQDELLKIWTASHRTVVYVTHSVDEAAYLADRVILLGIGVKGVCTDVMGTGIRPRIRGSSEIERTAALLRQSITTQPCLLRPTSDDKEI